MFSFLLLSISFGLLHRSDDGQCKGIVGVSPEWSDWWACEYWWVISIYVAPDARRLGIASKLLQFVVSEGQRQGAQTVNLRVERDNKAAQVTSL